MQQTRAMYDSDNVKVYSETTEKPMRYITDAKIAERKTLFVHPESVDASSELRQQPTRLNYYNRPETELFGTAPYKALGHRAYVDTESKLRNREYHQEQARILTEEQFFRPEYITDGNQVDTNLRAAATRVDIRNKYCGFTRA